jgi:hypothetical protein
VTSPTRDLLSKMQGGNERAGDMAIDIEEWRAELRRDTGKFVFQSDCRRRRPVRVISMLEKERIKSGSDDPPA